MATFQMRLKGDDDTVPADLVKFSEAIEQEVRSVALRQDIEDLVSSVSSTQPRITVRIRTDLLADRGLDVSQVTDVLATAYGDTRIAPLHDGTFGQEPRNIIVSITDNVK